MRKWSLALMSYKEIGAIPKDGSVLLVPIGCVEQHGPAGFTGADTILAEYVCRRTAEGLDDVYVAPPLWFGYTPYTAFPGTVSLRLDTLRAVVQDVVGGYIAHGFRHVVIVNNHGPNEAAIEPVAAKMRQRHGVLLAILYPWRLANHVARDITPNADQVFGHGGEPTISVMMALAPDAVALEGHAETRGYVASDGPISVASYRTGKFQGFEIGLFNEASDVLPSGASGDWSVASEARGRQILDRMVAYAREFVPAFLRLSQEAQRRRAAGSARA
ncbi:MAG TPA: creatininase family protein [bacterium]|nr:creatininase family protein [bacterium]